MGTAVGDGHAPDAILLPSDTARLSSVVVRTGP
jgi:hypothetical protein